MNIAEEVAKMAEKSGMTQYIATDNEVLIRFAQEVARKCANIAYNDKDGEFAAMDILYEFDVDSARTQK